MSSWLQPWPTLPCEIPVSNVLVKPHEGEQNFSKAFSLKWSSSVVTLSGRLPADYRSNMSWVVGLFTADVPACSHNTDYCVAGRTFIRIYFMYVVKPSTTSRVHAEIFVNGNSCPSSSELI